MSGVPGEVPVVGNRRCPHCLHKFTKLRPSAGATRRDCPCGKRWMLSFEPLDERLGAKLGGGVRLVVEPYVDGRRRKPAPVAGQQQLELVAVEPLAAAAKPVRRVVRGTTFAKRR